MRSTNSRTETEADRFTIAIVTTDERVGPEATTYLADDYDLCLLETWDELTALIHKRPPEAVLLDLDTVGERSEDGITALTELRALAPDLVLVGLTRSNSHNLRLKAVGATVDEYFVAPIDFEEVRDVLNRALQKRALKIECRQRHSEQAERESFFD